MTLSGEHGRSGKPWVVCLAPFRADILTMKLPCELLKQSQAMKAIFFKKYTQGGAGESTRSKEVVTAGDSKLHVIIN